MKSCQAQEFYYEAIYSTSGMIIQDKGACTYGPVQCTTIQMPYRWYRSQYTYERFRSKQQDWSNYYRYIFSPGVGHVIEALFHPSLYFTL